MIPVDGLIALFHRMYDEHWAYKWGSAQTGCVDCAGAFVWAYRQYGQSIYHGSNRIARVYVDELLPVSAARPGMAAFKVRKPGQQYYDLKAEYKQGGKYYNGTMNDYYHVGLVDNDPRYVLNAQSAKTGFVRSKIDGWACVGRLKAVDYGEEEITMNKYVYADSGKTVNLRKGAGVTYPVIAQVPIGAEVAVQGATNTGWSAVKYGEKAGYMMTKFLRDVPEKANDGDTNWDDTRKEAYAHLHAARLELDAAMALLSDAG